MSSPLTMPPLAHLLAAAAGGALGAVCRFVTTQALLRLAPSSAFPWGTLCVNLAGSLLLGLLLGLSEAGRWAISPTWRVLIGVGFLGALTTFSTFAVENLVALRVGDLRTALLNIAANLVGTLLLCWLGFELGNRL